MQYGLLAVKLGEHLDQPLHAVLGESVVNARTQSADRAMPRQAAQPGLLGAGEQRCLDLGGIAAEGDVHVRSAAGPCMPAPAPAAIEKVVEHAGLARVALAERRQAALLADPRA